MTTPMIRKSGPTWRVIRATRISFPDSPRWLPEADAPGALRKNSFDFDPISYTWKLKAAEEAE